MQFAALLGCVYRHHPNVISIQGAFVIGRPLLRVVAPSLSGYVFYGHLIRNGLVSYVHSTLLFCRRLYDLPAYRGDNR